MSVFSVISKLVDPIARLIDDLHTSDEEKGQLKAQLAELHYGSIQEMLSYEKVALESQVAVIKAEVQSESWLTRSWRPIVMLTLTSIIVLYWFGLGPEEIPPDLWLVIQLGLGGYTVGRSAEKVVAHLKAAKEKEEL